MKPYDKLITLITTITLAIGLTYLCTRADDPAHPAPDAGDHPPMTNAQPTSPRPVGPPQRIMSGETNKPPMPVYIITEMYVVTTPQGPLARIDECDFQKLAKLFGGVQKITNFTIYAK